MQYTLKVSFQFVDIVKLVGGIKCFCEMYTCAHALFCAMHSCVQMQTGAEILANTDVCTHICMHSCKHMYINRVFYVTVINSGLTIENTV